jgi:hypothetical protein
MELEMKELYIEGVASHDDPESPVINTDVYSPEWRGLESASPCGHGPLPV